MIGEGENPSLYFIELANENYTLTLTFHFNKTALHLICRSRLQCQISINFISTNCNYISAAQ